MWNQAGDIEIKTDLMLDFCSIQAVVLRPQNVFQLTDSKHQEKFCENDTSHVHFPRYFFSMIKSKLMSRRLLFYFTKIMGR